MNKLKLLGLAAVALLASVSVRADLVTTNIFADLVVRGGGAWTNTNSVVFTTVTTPGIIEVKSGSSLGTAGGVRKGYFKFNVPANMNTNANLVFTFTLATGSQNQRIQLYGLNEPYTNFNAATTAWTNAQANNVANSNLLTSGGLTATLLSVSNVITTGAAVQRSVTIAGGASGWGRVLKSDNTICLAMTGLFDSLYNSGSPIKIATNSETLTFYTITSGNPPTISTINDFSIGDQYSGATVGMTNYFTVADPDEPAGNLVMSAFSSNESAVSSNSIFFGGSGSSRFFIITNGLVAGTANITVTATDSAGNPAQTYFKITVNQTAPSIVASHTNTLLNTAVAMPVSVTQPGLNSSLIALTASSGNTTLVQSSGVVVSGTGTNRTVTVTPVTGQDGVAPIIMIATSTNIDTVLQTTNLISSTNRYCVMVLPSTNVVFSDRFDYLITDITGFDPISTDSGDFWFSRAGAGGTKVKVSSGVVQILSGPNVQSIIAPLKGGPYVPGAGRLFTTTFKVQWISSPVGSPDSGNVVALYDETAGSTTGLRGRLSTTNSPGGFRLRVQNSEAGDYSELPVDLAAGTLYTVRLQHDQDNAQTVLTLDPLGTPASVTNVDMSGPRTLHDISLRQGTDTGPLFIDDLQVSVSTKAVVGPTITADLQSITNCDGTTNTLSVAATGTERIEYNWFKVSDPTNSIQTGTSTNHTVTVTNGGDYTYYVVVSNLYGVVTSSVASIVVSVPPSIGTQPQSQTNNVGGSANFTVAATGVGPFTYQWQRAGTNLPGATASSLTVSPLTTNDAAVYQVFVANSCGTTPSATATLTVNASSPPPTVPSITTITTSGANLLIDFTGSNSDVPGDFTLVGGTAVTAPIT
ncbi:MAG: hypothetical protein RLY20_276, partial [Verrucomicrobiota bacterium]